MKKRTGQARSKTYTRIVTQCFFCPHYDFGSDGVSRCFANSETGRKLRASAIKTRIDPKCPLPDAEEKRCT